MATQEQVLQIEFKDRPHLAYEILELFEQHSIDKSRLEVVPKANKLFMVIKIKRPIHIPIEQIKLELLKIPNVLSVRFREYMPSEERERRLQTILNSVSEGIIAVDNDGTIQHMNDMARQIFDCKPADAGDIALESLFPVRSPIFDALQSGRPVSNTEQHIQTATKDIHFFISCTPILGPKGNAIGLVATIKDYRQVEEITSKVNQKKNSITFDSIIHQSPIMKKIIETAKIVAHGTSSILLRGESGTGKEMFAKAIHNESSRRNHPFVAINCGALPDTLLESELFGYEPGAFTGAAKNGRRGIFEQANTGTIFLDEIGEISRPMQVRLLRVLQEQTIRRVGGEKDVVVDVRIITATNRNLEELIKQGEFREDLYYRLNVIPLLIPPLRERKEDIQLIAQHLIRKICRKLRKPEKYLTKESMAFLLSLNFPGNIRQLENLLELAVNLEKTNEIHTGHFTDKLKTETLPDVPAETAAASAIRIPIPADGKWPPLKEIIRTVETQIIGHIMKDNPSSRKIGNILGVSNTTILKKLKYATKPDNS